MDKTIKISTKWRMIKRVFSVFLVFAMLVGVITSSGFFVQKADAASGDWTTIELNGTQDEIASQFKTFVDGNADLKKTLTDAIDPSANSTHLLFTELSNNIFGFDMYWTPSSVSLGYISGSWDYNKRYQMILSDVYDGTLDYNVYVTLQPSANAFTDIQGHWAYDDINWAVESGIMDGMDATHFVPDGTLTRAMLAAILMRQSDVSSEENLAYYNTTSFKDSDQSAWWNPYVEWAKGCGYVDGFEDGTFRPNDSITRQDLATILMRYIGGDDGDIIGDASLNFSDKDQISDYAQNAVLTLTNDGIINGMGDGNFNPKGTATRAQVAKMIKALVAAGLTGGDV